MQIDAHYNLVHYIQLLELSQFDLIFFSSFKVGVTTQDIDQIVHQAAISFGAYPSPLNYKKFPKSVCTSVNNVAVHGIPDR